MYILKYENRIKVVCVYIASITVHIKINAIIKNFRNIQIFLIYLSFE